MSGMRVLVCGGRDYTNRPAVFAWLDWLEESFYDDGGIVCVIHGCAPNVDTFAGEWAKEHGKDVLEFPADWSVGRKAGPMRNQRMIDIGKPDVALALPGGKGTADMVRRAERADIMVIQIKVET